MATLSWGKPSKFQFCTVNDGVKSEDWNDLPIPKEDSLNLTPTEGTEMVATEEGGDVVDVRYGKTTYVVEWDEFVKKGDSASFEDNDGVVTGEFALRWLPEDDECEGVLIDRCAIVATKNYTVANGILRHYKAKVLKPATGKSVKPYFKDALAVSPTALYFSSAADTSAGKTITVTASGTVSATSSDSTWCKAEVSSKSVKVTMLSANTTGEVRTAKITIEADGLTAVVPVTQIPA